MTVDRYLMVIIKEDVTMNKILKEANSQEEMVINLLLLWKLTPHSHHMARF